MFIFSTVDRRLNAEEIRTFWISQELSLRSVDMLVGRPTETRPDWSADTK